MATKKQEQNQEILAGRNIYQKLQHIRCELQELKLKKSGHNTFAKYSYYELKDFIPAVNSLMNKHGVCTIVNFGKEEAQLTIVNSENPEEQIAFYSPLADAGLKGCTPVQNLGAVQTYIRRYLYSNAFEIVEDDALDASTGKNGNGFISEEQRNEILDLMILTKTDEGRFLKYIGADAVDRIPASRFNAAITALNKKRGNGNGNS